jgi:hypothetical protein
MGAIEWSAPPTPFHFISAIRLGDGMHLQLAGETNHVVEIYASTDFILWTSLITLTNETGQISYSDSQATNHMRRFYRAVQSP